MNERIKEITEHAGFKYSGQLQYWTELKIELFAELIRADEREACAKLCDSLLANPHRGGGWSDACIECSVSIRARKQ